jgi:tetratricopeptide (TPR) repeat protein
VWRPAASVGTPSTAPAAAAAGDSAAGAGTPTVAVGLIADFREERGGSARPLADMLATNLARARGVRVISPARIHELLHQIGATDTAVGAFVVAARRAGVGELVDGTLYALPDGMLRLDLRRVDVASGAMRAGLTIQGRDLFALADSGTARLLTDMGVAGVRGSIADVTTRSEEAYRVYDLGLRARVAGRPDSARALFARALALDPGFAMAAYHHAMMRTDRADRAAGLVVAARLAERASERERLLIRTRWTSYMAMPELRAIADSLVARYPAEVEGHYYAGMARLDAAEWVAARAPLERAIAMDSLALRTAIGTAEVGTGCTACSALRELARSYWAAGDGAGAVRTARRWTRLQPDGWAAWSELGEQLDMTSRFTDARAAYDSALARGVDPSTGVWLLVRHELRRGRLDEAERLARGRLDVGSLDARSAALWAYFHTLRHQGRLREAEVAARRFRVLLDSIAGGRATAGEAFNHAIILLEAGRSHEAAALFDSIVHGRLRRGEDPHSLARHRPNALALAAWARWRSGDTTSLARLADSTEAAGAVHGWRLQQRMHHEVRAMLLSARGDHARAIDAWRAAMVSPTRYASRQGLEAGRLLTATGRPREAVAVLQPTLRGWIEGLGTLTEGHEALAEAWARIPGQVALDSAAAHWRYVADAWRDGDPGYAARAAAARERLGAIGRRAP